MHGIGTIVKKELADHFSLEVDVPSAERFLEKRIDTARRLFEEGKPEEESDTFIAVNLEEDLYNQGLDEVMARLEKKMIERALAKTDNSKIRAAELLKISFRSLRYKVQKYDIK